MVDNGILDTILKRMERPDTPNGHGTIPLRIDRGLFDSIESLLADAQLWHSLGFHMVEADRDEEHHDGGLEYRDYTFL